jgi:hypothetical protein
MHDTNIVTEEGSDGIQPDLSTSGGRAETVGIALQSLIDRHPSSLIKCSEHLAALVLPTQPGFGFLIRFSGCDVSLSI